MPRTILLADDSLTIRKVAELTFSDTDIRVETAADGREALERLDAIRPDLVVADVVMPEPTGYEICRAVKGSAHPVPVLLLAGTFEPFDVDLALACGADDHLVKPFESSALLERVSRLLDESARAIPGGAPAAAPPVPAARPPVPGTMPLTEEQLEAVTRAVVERLSDRVLREIAWEVVPELADLIVRERLRGTDPGEPGSDR